MPAHSFDVFDLHSRVMEDYKSFVSSFVHIQDQRIKNTVEQRIEAGEFWPEPLIRFNPAYEIGGDAESLIRAGVLHEDFRHIYPEYKLYRHQIEAIKKGISGSDFIVTSGTGSGKSLTYMSVIFDAVLRKQQQVDRGISAVIVYPMNALINSQFEELKKYRDTYYERTGRKFPVRFEKYTGQEDFDTRHRIQDNPPDILLTNYMMLELILTRKYDKNIRNSMRKNLQFLTFDELHTYRGRQGADVAMLIRRIRASAEQKVLCIGTSATMASGEGTLSEERKSVANFASFLFGKPFNEDQIVSEYLEASATGHEKWTDAQLKKKLTEVLSGKIELSGDKTFLLKHPLVYWLERKVALNEREGVMVRGTPRTLSEIGSELATLTGLNNETCGYAVEECMRWIGEVNTASGEHGEQKDEAYILPFKLHQFISQTGAVYVSLDDPENRDITLEPKAKERQNGEIVRYFPVLFSRGSGTEFLCVRRVDQISERNAQIFEPRDPSDLLPPDDEDAETESELGYLIPYSDAWNPEKDMEKLPDAWFRKNKDGNVRYEDRIPAVDKKRRARIPYKVWYDRSGRYSFNEDSGLPLQGWYMSLPLLFDPTSGSLFSGNASENTKLSRLGNEGRSTSTTVLSLNTLKHMPSLGVREKERKLMSFTDNRQDASLQSGHFNDFISTVRVRAAIYKALSDKEILKLSQIQEAVHEVLKLNEAEYATDPSNGGFPGKQRRNEEAFRTLLMYRILEDLKHGWQVTVPNLEDCGLLNMDYFDLEENAFSDSGWQEVPYIAEMDGAERQDFLYRVLEFFRKTYALYDPVLTDAKIRENENDIRRRIKLPWGLGENEKIEYPNFVRIVSLPKKQRIYTQSAGPLSALGRYIKDLLLKQGISLKKEEYTAFLEKLFHSMADAGWLRVSDFAHGKSESIKLYQLYADSIIWRVGDGTTVQADPVLNRAFRVQEIKPNRFFKDLYVQSGEEELPLEGGEHTGQLNNDDRIEREDGFREGKYNVLFCSPTMELGIDISELNVVHMRNVPPSPANYAQRSGRAGRSGQPALVITSCSAFSPHDRHYFAHAKEMVAGVVRTPRIDILAKELLETHLNSLYLAQRDIDGIHKSVANLLDFSSPELPLKINVTDALQISPTQRDELRSYFENMTADFADRLPNQHWYYRGWIEDVIDGMPRSFDACLTRWRDLYTDVQKEIVDTTNAIKAGTIPSNSKEMSDIQFRLRRANRERALLQNETNGGQPSEFYPYRYFAAEGFLPGYNFTRLPINSFIEVGRNVTAIGRSRFQALREFGPQNIIYHMGGKFRIDRIMLTDIEGKLSKLKYAPDSGYLMEGPEYDKNRSPFNGVDLTGDNAARTLGAVLSLSDMKTKSIERISCQEEIRTTHGYDIKTLFSMEGRTEKIKETRVSRNGRRQFTLKYMPACRIYKINTRWRSSKEEGFHLNMRTGFWQKELQNPPQSGPAAQVGADTYKSVMLKTSIYSDALYIEPGVQELNTEEELVTFMYAFKQGLVRSFEVEEDEIEVVKFDENSNLLLYEAAEGSLGVLAQVVEEAARFKQIIKTAWELCSYKDTQYKAFASYRDLLSYYNQPYHNIINRYAIQELLEELQDEQTSVEVLATPYQHREGFMATVKGQAVEQSEKSADTEGAESVSGEYEAHYRHLLEMSDDDSDLERRFLKELYERRRRLPDHAQKPVPGLRIVPDFFYEPDHFIFCDGSAHDDPAVQERDQQQRRQIEDAGYFYLVYYYQDDIDTLIERNPDVFKKVYG